MLLADARWTVRVATRSRGFPRGRRREKAPRGRGGAVRSSRVIGVSPRGRSTRPEAARRGLRDHAKPASKGELPRRRRARRPAVPGGSSGERVRLLRGMARDGPARRAHVVMPLVQQVERLTNENGRSSDLSARISRRFFVSIFRSNSSCIQQETGHRIESLNDSLRVR